LAPEIERRKAAMSEHGKNYPDKPVHITTIHHCPKLTVLLPE
jgi:hypothetical protein